MDRRKEAEESYRKKFDELGLSERFELVHRIWEKRSDRRFWCKCKTCGTEFLRSNDVLRGKQQRLLCPECGAASDGNDIFARSQTVKSAAEYYVQGHTVKETAEQFGLTKWQVNGLVKARKLTNGNKFIPGSNADTERRKKEAEQRLITKLTKLGFEYLGGYENKKSKVKLRCPKCGYEFEQRADGITNHLRCINCQKIATQERHEEQRRIAAQQAEARRIEREWYRLLHPPKPKNDYTEQHEAFLNRSGICEICGKQYAVREYVKSRNLKFARDAGVCSNECYKKKQNKSVRASHKRRGVQDNHRHRARKYGCAYDPTVTLKRLIARDGLRCAICGEMCDPNDRSWSKYCGPASPTMDHIIPMAKGGGHVWENVQVAHMICNSLKRDSLEKEA